MKLSRIVRQAQQTDLSELLLMIHALARHHGDQAQITGDDLIRLTQNPRSWLTILVAEAGQGLIGYAALSPMIQLQFGAQGLDIHHLYVKAEARGQGVGRALTDAALKRAHDQGCRYVTVGTDPRNAKVQQFYTNAGFDVLPLPGPRFRKRI